MHLCSAASAACRSWYEPVPCAWTALPAGGESGDEEEGERLDQQMGETGAEGEDVDERLWNEEDKEQEQQGQVRCAPS